MTSSKTTAASILAALLCVGGAVLPLLKGTEVNWQVVVLSAITALIGYLAKDHEE